MKKVLIRALSFYIPFKEKRKKFRNFLDRIFSLNQFVKIFDFFIQKNKNFWVFPVCSYSHNLSSNMRAIFEKVKNNKNIKKIILIRGKKIKISGENVVFIPKNSFKGIYFLVKSKVIFLKHSVFSDITFSLSNKKHLIINLWHGIPIKRISSTDLENKKFYSNLNYSFYPGHYLICSSDIDRLAMATSFGISYYDTWLTGLPRNDFILMKERNLPIDFKQTIAKLKEKLKNKKFVLYAPTYRDNKEKGCYKFSKKEKQSLLKILTKNNAILGIREHIADPKNSYALQLKDLPILNLTQKDYPYIEILYRISDILISDYSGCLIDFMLTNKPIINFCYDYDDYLEKRGVFYDMDLIFPHSICKTFDEFLNLLKITFANKEEKSKYEISKKIFFKYLDSNNTDRLLEEIKLVNK